MKTMRTKHNPAFKKTQPLPMLNDSLTNGRGGEGFGRFQAAKVAIAPHQQVSAGNYIPGVDGRLTTAMTTMAV